MESKIYPHRVQVLKDLTKAVDMTGCFECEVRSMVKDSVCGMTVNEKDANFRSQYDGKTYYFCSIRCKSTFDKNPSRYAGK